MTKKHPTLVSLASASIIVTLEKAKLFMCKNVMVNRNMNNTLELKVLVSGTCICKLSGEGAIAYCTVESCLTWFQW